MISVMKCEEPQGLTRERKSPCSASVIKSDYGKNESCFGAYRKIREKILERSKLDDRGPLILNR